MHIDKLIVIIRFQRRRFSFILIISGLILVSCNRPEEVNYDESKVPFYSLPELLLTGEGRSVQSSEEWIENRREEILELFESNVYGEYPEGDYTISFEEVKSINNFMNGKAILREIKSRIKTQNGELDFTILSVMPHSDHTVPVFVGLNSKGNHTIDSFDDISVHTAWIENDNNLYIENNRVDERSRGARVGRWPLSTIINRGYGLITVYYGEFDPDYDDGFLNGLHPLFAEVKKAGILPNTGSISIWAKGMSLMMDFLETDTLADQERIIAIGHSRLGKAALWAGANDTRFDAVISNNSGCGGAALSRRNYGETVKAINTMFPHWFNTKFKSYNRKLKKLPVDQHMLLALIAPRPIYIASATEDQWADPNGEFLSLKESTRVYDLFGYEQDFPDVQPLPDQPYHGITGYHYRTGPHDLTEADWVNYLDWCDVWLSVER